MSSPALPVRGVGGDADLLDLGHADVPGGAGEEVVDQQTCELVGVGVVVHVLLLVSGEGPARPAGREQSSAVGRGRRFG